MQNRLKCSVTHFVCNFFLLQEYHFINLIQLDHLYIFIYIYIHLYKILCLVTQNARKILYKHRIVLYSGLFQIFQRMCLCNKGEVCALFLIGLKHTLVSFLEMRWCVTYILIDKQIEEHYIHNVIVSLTSIVWI